MKMDFIHIWMAIVGTALFACMIGILLGCGDDKDDKEDD